MFTKSRTFEAEDETGGGGSLIGDAGSGNETPPSGEETPPAGETPPNEGTPAEGGKGEKPPAEGATAEVKLDDLTLPEGMEADENVEAFVKLMNKADMSPAERAQELINLQANLTKSVVEGMTKELQEYWDARRAENVEAVKALPGFEGDKLDANLAQIKKGLEAVGATEATFKAFTETGAGDHPEIVRVLYELTKPLAEQTPARGEPAKGTLTQAERLFGNSQ